MTTLHLAITSTDCQERTSFLQDDGIGLQERGEEEEILRQAKKRPPGKEQGSGAKAPHLCRPAHHNEHVAPLQYGIRGRHEMILPRVDGPQANDDRVVTPHNIKI